MIQSTDGPAIENADGGKAWYVNGWLHRTDGPAIEYKDGRKEWWINGSLVKPHINFSWAKEGF